MWAPSPPQSIRCPKILPRPRPACPNGLPFFLLLTASLFERGKNALSSFLLIALERALLAVVGARAHRPILRARANPSARSRLSRWPARFVREGPEKV